MADLLSLLSNAANSLAAQRALSATASHNIANANTAGYARQRADLQATAPGELVGTSWLGRGAELGAVTQARDRFVEAQVPGVLAQASRSTAESDALTAVHALDPERAGSVSSAIGAFYGALRTLSQNPGDAGLRAATLASAQALATTFQRTSQEISSARSGLDARISGSLQEVNAAARAVAASNAAIQRARAAGGEPNDLLDLRQKQLDALASLTGAAPVPQADGAIDVILPGGGALVSGSLAGALSTQPDPSNAGLSRFLLGAPDGSTPAPLGAGALGGSIGGAVDARDGALRKALAGLDQLASDLAGTLNAAHATGYGLDGSTGRALFVAADGGAITASNVGVALSDARQLATAAGASGASGDGGNALALLATERSPLTGGLDAQGTVSSLTSAFGAESQRAQAFADQDAGLRDQLLAMRESVSGVSIDEEMVEMQRAQRAYEALAKVMAVADEMTQTLLKLR